MKYTSGLFIILLASCHPQTPQENIKNNTAEKSLEMANPLDCSPLRLSFLEDELRYLPSFPQEKEFCTLSTVKSTVDKKHPKFTEWTIVERPMTGFNHVETLTKVREFKINALNLQIGGSETSEIYRILHNSPDITSVEINAETVEIKEPLNLPGTNVTINAQKIIFSDKGQINTTPLSRTYLPLERQNGLHGLKAGDIKITADKYVLSSAATHLIANGGNGQPAGPGINGARGTNAVIVHQPNSYNHTVCFDLSGFCRFLDDGRPSGNGGDAIQGGIPGNGGDAGKIVLNKSVQILYSAEGGVSGQQDIHRPGGAPGTPEKTCKTRFDSRWGPRELGCVTAVPGKGVAPQVAAKIKGQSSELEVIEAPVNFNSIALSKIKFSQDAYRKNQIDVAKAELEELVSLIGNNFDSKANAQRLLNQIVLHKDFYGKAKTWTPNLNLEVSFRAFEKEVKRSLKIIYFTSLINSKATPIVKRKEAILELQDELLKNIDSESKRITSFVEQASAIKSSLIDVEVAQNKFEFELKHVEEEIKNMAQDNLEVPILKKALGIIAAASKVIPVGQPALGMIGTGIDFIDQVSNGQMEASEIIAKTPTLIKEFSSADWKQSFKDLDKKLKEIDPSRVLRVETMKEKMEILEELNAFTTPIRKAVSDQLKVYREQEVSKTKLEEEINKIKKDHPRFKKLTASLEKLHAQQKNFIEEIANFNNDVETSIATINSSYVSIVEGSMALEKDSYLTSDFVSYLSQMRESALANLDYYHYHLAKSYEYRYLRAYNQKFDLQDVLKRTEILIADESQSMDEKLGQLQLFYQQELGSLVKEIFTTDTTARIEREKEYNLTEEEMAALNKGEKIFIDLTKFYSEDDVRIRSVKLMDNVFVENGPSSLELMIQHSGRSLFENSGRVYVFDHEEVNSSNLTWISSKGRSSSVVRHSRVSPVQLNLFKTLFDLNPESEIFIRPAGVTFLSLELKKGNPESSVQNINLLVEYEGRIKR